jgi:hypothetical protein
MRLVGSCRTSSDRNAGHYGRPGRDRVRVEERQDPLDAGMAEHAPGRGRQVVALARLVGAARVKASPKSCIASGRLSVSSVTPGGGFMWLGLRPGGSPFRLPFRV